MKQMYKCSFHEDHVTIHHLYIECRIGQHHIHVLIKSRALRDISPKTGVEILGKCMKGFPCCNIGAGRGTSDSAKANHPRTHQPPRATVISPDRTTSGEKSTVGRLL